MAAIDIIYDETTEFSGTGLTCATLLIVLQPIFIMASLVGQASGTAWIALNVVFATGAVIGRRRSYHVRTKPVHHVREIDKNE
jgi:hypothetical protein